MKNIILLLFAFIAIYSCSSTMKYSALADPTEVASASSYTYINTGGDNGYILDSLTYEAGNIDIMVGFVKDSTALMADVIADTLITSALLAQYEAAFNMRAAQLQAIQAEKTQDSLRKEAYAARLTQQKLAITNIQAN